MVEGQREEGWKRTESHGHSIPGVYTHTPTHSHMEPITRRSRAMRLATAAVATGGETRDGGDEATNDSEERSGGRASVDLNSICEVWRRADLS